jgi:predicted permease
MIDALRVFRRAPGPAATIVLSLAIGIGANSAIFSVAYALLARPLPYQDADRLVILWNRSPGLGITEDWFSTAQYFDIRAAATGFEQVAIAIGANFNLTGDGEPVRIGAVRTSSNLLPMLGVRPAAGRLFAEADDAAGAPLKALLSDATWTGRYGRDPAVIGRSLTLNGVSVEVVGVLPPGFDLPREAVPTLGGAEHADLVLSLPLAADAAQVRNREDYNIVATLKRGVARAQAQREMDALTERLRRDHPGIYPPHGGLTFDIVPLHEQVVGDVRASLIVLIAAAAGLLLIASVNVANLLLSSSLDRRREMAIRTALGAARRQITGLWLLEGVWLGLAGGVLGLGLAALAIGALDRVGRATVPRLDDVGISGVVLAFTLLVSVTAGVLCALPAVLRIRRDDPQRALAGTRGASAAGLAGSRRQ